MTFTVRMRAEAFVSRKNTGSTCPVVGCRWKRKQSPGDTSRPMAMRIFRDRGFDVL